MSGSSNIQTQELCSIEETLVWCGGMDMITPQGEASDVIVVPNENTNLPPSCSDFLVQFEDNNTTTNNSKRISVTVNGSQCQGMEMKLTEKGCRFIKGESLKPPLEALHSLLKLLVKGKNTIRYSLFNDTTNQVMGRAEANLFLWSVSSHVIVCDIDGTITKSNARGVLDTMVLESYAYAHDGVCEFLSHLKQLDDSLQILYLTSRPVSYAKTTRRFLEGLRQAAAAAAGEDDDQQQQHSLPHGPLFMHPGTLGTVLFSELVSKDTHMYKHDTLMRQVVLVFAAAGRDSMKNLLISGFGNALTDSVAYEMAGISRQDIYMIDKKSQISCMNASADSIVNHVKVNSQGSLVVVEERTTSISERDLANSRRDLMASSQQASARKQRKSLHRQYSQLIGSSYNGYHDVSLWEHVSSKIRASLEL